MPSSTTSAASTSTSAVASTLSASSNLKVRHLALSIATRVDSSLLQVVGIILAVASGLLIGSSFVFKKKGLLRSQAGHTAGEGVAYLKSVSVALTPQHGNPLIVLFIKATMVARHE
jgi:hypothetical protein